jgi:hypothetical protein
MCKIVASDRDGDNPLPRLRFAALVPFWNCSQPSRGDCSNTAVRKWTANLNGHLLQHVFPDTHCFASKFVF